MCLVLCHSDQSQNKRKISWRKAHDNISAQICSHRWAKEGANPQFTGSSTKGAPNRDCNWLYLNNPCIYKSLREQSRIISNQDLIDVVLHQNTKLDTLLIGNSSRVRRPLHVKVLRLFIFITPPLPVLAHSPIPQSQPPSMGQTLSALRRNRGVNENAQCPSALGEGSKGVISPKVEPTESMRYKIGSTLSSIIERTSPQAFPISRKLETENIRTTLLILPTELILNIADRLTPSGFMSLSYSCRTIRNKMAVSMTQVLGHEVLEGQVPDSGSTVELRNILFLERLEMRCMLDHDIRTRLRTHEYSMSSTSSLSVLDIQGHSSDKTRLLDSARCSLGTRQVWICPHRVLDYFEATKNIDGLHLCGSASVANYGKTYFSRWPVVRVLSNSVPSIEAVKEAMNEFGAFLCPHLRLNAACVASHYNSGCRRLRDSLLQGFDSAPHCFCKICSSKQVFTAICDFCNTQIRFEICARIHGVEMLYIVIMRDFQSISSHSERAWISQVTHPADFEECDEAWRATDAECWRRLGLEDLL